MVRFRRPKISRAADASQAMAALAQAVANGEMSRRGVRTWKADRVLRQGGGSESVPP
jgi:hypothetical protein